MEKINAGVFLKVAELGSFKAAADELGYTQADISYIINAMEEELEIKLFVREYSGVALTPEGNSLLPWFGQLYNSQRLLQNQVNELKNLNTGTIRILSTTSASIYWLPGIIKQFHTTHPNINVELMTCDDQEEAESHIYNRQVDCGFLVAPTKKELTLFPLREEPLLAVLSPSHPAAHLQAFPLSDIGKYPYISMTYDETTEVYELFHSVGQSPNTSYTTDNDYAALSMISQDLGYGIFSQLLLENPPFPLVCLPFDPPVTRNICMGVRNYSNCSMAAKAFIRCALEWIKEKYDN